MNRDLFARWTAAILSGQYDKGGNTLRTVGAKAGEGSLWRALGVLCDVADEDGWKIDSYGKYAWHGAGILVPAWAQEQFGLAADIPIARAPAADVSKLDSSSPTWVEFLAGLKKVVKVDRDKEPFKLDLPTAPKKARRKH